MNTERIRNYNHRLLAVLGTLLVIFLIIGMVFIVVFIIKDLRMYSGYKNHDMGILSDEKIAELQAENKRRQLISYETPVLVDTLNLIYIIPVSHKTLNSDEFINDELYLLLNSNRSYKSDSRYSRQYYGNYNNLLIFDMKKETVETFFHQRTNFLNFQTEIFKDDIIIMLNASINDTYKDGVINQQDLRSLYLYSLNEKKLREITIENADIFEMSFVENTKNLIITYGLDYNMDGKFDEYSEPSKVMFYDYDNEQLQNIINNEIDKELQMKLEGKKL